MRRTIEFRNYREFGGGGLASICIPPVHHDRDLFVGLVEDGFEAVESADAAGEEPGAGHVFVADEIFCLWQFQFGGRAADEDIVLRAVRLRLHAVT